MSEAAVYDHIAEEYKTSKQLPFRKYVEEYTLSKLLGSLEGMSMLDLACGEGIYSRKFRLEGADSVLGVDISAEMIRLAQMEEELNSLGCKFMVSDAKRLDLGNKFDLVTGVYLLNYASTKQELLAYCQAVYDHLKEGGRFVGINDNPFNSPENYAKYIDYGFIKSTPEDRKEGDPITYTMFNPDGTTCTFDNYFLTPETYAAAFIKAGFRKFTWHQPELATEQRANPHWHFFIKNPPIIAFEAVR